MDYREAIYRDYAENVLSQANRMDEADWEGYYRYFRKNYADILPADRNARIVDGGCGGGQFLYFLERMGYTNYLGVDGSPSCVEVCRRADRPVEEAHITEYLAEHPGEFDAIVLNDLIEHFSKQEAFDLFTAARDALKPGGRLIVKTPNMGCPLFAGRGRYCDITHEIGFTERSLEAFYSAAGFENARAFGPDVHTSPYAVANVIARLCWKLLRTVYKAIFRLYGHRGETVMTRVIIGVGDRPAEGK